MQIYRFTLTLKSMKIINNIYIYIFLKFDRNFNFVDKLRLNIFHVKYLYIWHLLLTKL